MNSDNAIPDVSILLKILGAEYGSSSGHVTENYDNAVRHAARQKIHEDRMEALSASNAGSDDDSATGSTSGTSDSGGWDPTPNDDTPGLGVGGAND